MDQSKPNILQPETLKPEGDTNLPNWDRAKAVEEIMETANRNAMEEINERKAIKAAYDYYVDQCGQRREWIESKRLELQRRIQLFRELSIQWNTWIDEAKADYKAARATPPPIAPRRNK